MPSGVFWKNRQHSRKVYIGLVLVPILFFFCATPDNLAADNSVTLELTGYEDPRCGVTGLTDRIELGNLDRGGSQTLAFTLACNTPFSASLTSRHGALVQTGAGEGAPAIAYQIWTLVRTTGGAALTGRCPSAQLQAGAACRFAVSGAAVALNEPAALTLSWDEPGESLPAGQYEDFLTLTLTPQP